MYSPNVVGQTVAFEQAKALALKSARSASSLLITGETGTGKEVLARLVHSESDRASRPFVAVNCAALPVGLAESELFGHEKGAFTGAVSARRGVFEEAHGGTLFLDEIGDLPKDIQAKLLRILEDGVVRPVGAERSKTVDVRVIAATNCNLSEGIQDGCFRKDLYYRLAVVELHLPLLKERTEDIAALAEHFLKKHGERNGSVLREVHPLALEAMWRYDWPGNVRELENVVERATVLAEPSDGVVLTPSMLPEAIYGATTEHVSDTLDMELDLKTATARMRKAYAMEALRRAEGNKTDAANYLGVSRRSFYHLLEETAAA